MPVRRERKNEYCFAGFPSCNYMFESARRCFIACPSDNEFGLELTIIKEVLESHNYEPYVAVESFEPAQSTFCRKICSQIIQSHFCIVLLNPPTRRNKEQLPEPNPNVHYEYGMMCALTKTVIPLAKEGTELAFNIAPLDTLFYNESNLKDVLKPAIEEAIKRASIDETGIVGGPNQAVYRYLSLRGLSIADLHNDSHKVIYDVGAASNLGLLTGPHYAYFADYSRIPDREICLNVTMLSRTFGGLIDRITRLINAEPAGPPTSAVKRINAEIEDVHIYIIVREDCDCKAIKKYLDSDEDFKKMEFVLKLITQAEIERDVEKALEQISI